MPEFIPNPETEACDPFLVPDTVSITLSAFYVLVFLLAIPGNLVVGLVMGHNRDTLPPSDLYLLHLAVADLLLAVTLPFWAVSVTWGWIFGNAACKIVTICQELSFYSSILFLTCISMDRYVVIVRALEARRANRRLLSWGVCAGVWAVATLLCVPAFFSRPSASDDPSRLVCHEQFPSSADEWRLATRILRHALGFVIPLAIMIPCYGVTIKRLLRVRGGFRRQRAMKVIVFVVVAFLLCWAPYHVALMTDTFFRSKVVPYRCSDRLAVDQALLATQSMGLLHSCVNPVLYAFVGEKFRKSLVQLMRKFGLIERTTRIKSSVSSEVTSTMM
ncbi:C-X-C chemokine receptor type 2-like isoform X2 [Betta splendens]|uniref:C-X-C chemokine receptor type 2-like isoform X2 n=1 Tax=Betta splendens TaxID=158456 RepID=A0A8M1H880_BETSP|nr:C-X-C chemokine receptor type 2-like isoform X2 [Betta splendens]